jgi:hypothetical protein
MDKFMRAIVAQKQRVDFPRVPYPSVMILDRSLVRSKRNALPGDIIFSEDEEIYEETEEEEFDDDDDDFVIHNDNRVRNRKMLIGR